MTKKKKAENLQIRPPVVVVLGHVDHGKTSLLDYIRKTNAKAADGEPRSVVERESGGITQHIGAYQVESNGKKITFIDTPGHEAFSQMRSRGVKVADVAILVVAAEEGVKPQTKEVISHIKEYNIPVVVALNKIDKPQANPGKVEGELAKEGILVESQGGKIPSVKISAKTGQGVDEMLEVVLLVAEMEELKSDPKKPATGVVIESYLDSRRGPTTTLLVLDGTLKRGDMILCGNSYGRARILEDFQGKLIDKADPSTPSVVVGINQAPIIGEKFSVEKSEEEAKTKAQEEKPAQSPKGIVARLGEKSLNIILKSDVSGSKEAIEEVIKNIKQENISINILKSEVGDISESDIKLAYSTNSSIIGFRVKAPAFILDLAQRQGIRINIFEIIYELVEEVKKGLSRLLEPEIVRENLGKVKVVAIFKKEKSRMIIGGKVISGKVKNKALVDVYRNEEKIVKGRIVELQQNKKGVGEVEKGKEAGILFEGEPIIQEGDILEAYQEERRKREL